MSAFGEKFRLYCQLVRLEKPIGSYLLLWPTLWALAIAGEGGPDPWILFVFVTGVFLMRSAGCAINDYADREFDRHVSRTRDRPLTTGRVSPREALMVFAVLCLVSLALVLTLNRLTIILSVVAVLLAASYPFMKRFHYLPQAHLGATFGWAIPMAFAAQLGTVPKEGWLLYVANIIWTLAYDTMYGMADREDDLKLGIKSSAILFGEYDRVVIASLQALFILSLALVGRELGFSGFYYYSLFVASTFLLYEQVMISKREPKRCFEAFLHNHWVGAIVFSGIIGNYYSL